MEEFYIGLHKYTHSKNSNAHIALTHYFLRDPAVHTEQEVIDIFADVKMGTSRSPWRWMILLSRFGVCFFGLGLYKSMSVFVPILVEDFNTSTSSAGVVCSLPYVIGVMTGILSTVLLKIWDGRTLMAVGGFWAAAGYIGAASSQTVLQLGLWLTLSSLGQSPMYIVVVVSQLEYFPGAFAAVNGITLAGAAVGMMILPPVVEQLLLTYGWRGALIIMGAISAHICVFGALIRPLPPEYKPVRSSGSNSPVDKLLEDSKIRKMWNAFKEHMDFSLFVDEPRFVMTQLIVLLGGIVFSGWHMYLIPHGISLGFGETLASLLATFTSIGTIIGRLSHGTFVDRGVVRATDLYSVTSVVMAGTLFLVSPASSYVALAIVATAVGFALGVIVPLGVVMTVDVLDGREATGFAIMYLCQGIGVLSGGYLCGWIRDMTGSYTTVFNTLGGVSIMGVLAMSLRLMPTRH